MTNFTSPEQLTTHLKKVMDKTIVEALPLIVWEVISDSEKGYVPIDTGRLRETVNETGSGQTQPKEGILVWGNDTDVQYARRRYYENNTGVEEWMGSIMANEGKNYKKIMTDIFNKNK